jgi:hypothetical protein
MDPEVISQLTGLAGVVMGGMVVLVPLMIIGTRFALKPLVEAWAKARQVEGPQAQLQDRRISLLEAEVQQLRGEVQRLSEGADFQRQLAAPAADAAIPSRVAASE